MTVERHTNQAKHAASPETTMFCKKGQCIIPTTGGWQENPGKGNNIQH
jgi:hypothetical protein